MDGRETDAVGSVKMNMKKAAWVPWEDNIKDNNIFYRFPDGTPSWTILMKTALAERGYDLNTVDIYENLHEVDFFFFGIHDCVWLNRLIRENLQDRTIYAGGEPAVVRPENSKEGYQCLLQQYAYIMSWNDDLVDGRRIFKRIIPYDFRKEWGDIPFSERKLLTNISGNKFSNQPMELYSERERVIDYFEQHDPENFDLYGTKWDVIRHPSYRGTIPNKKETYHHYRFALSLENTYGVRGYITEKIFDCFTAGVVPIYLGASDVGDYIPKECYIDYGMFSSPAALSEYLHEMSEEQWLEYIAAIGQFLNSDKTQRFRGEIYGNEIADVADRIGEVHLEIPRDLHRGIQREARRQSQENLRIKTILALKKVLNHD